MSVPWGRVAIGAAAVVGVAGAVIAFWPHSDWEPAEIYSFELTRDSPDPGLVMRHWLVTVENDRVTSAILQDSLAGSEYVSSTLPTIEDLLAETTYYDDETYEVTYENGIPASFCRSRASYPKSITCDYVAEYTPISAEEARLARTWVEPASYSVTVDASSFNTQFQADWRVFVKDGVVIDATPVRHSPDDWVGDPETRSVAALIDVDRSTNPYRTVFWREGDPNPTAMCGDIPDAYDDEFCDYFLDYEINP